MEQQPTDHVGRRARVLELVEAGRADAAIAQELGVTRETVRSIRRRAGVAPGAIRADGSWQARLRELYDSGATVAQMVERTGWRSSTVYNRLAELGLSLRERRAAAGLHDRV